MFYKELGDCEDFFPLSLSLSFSLRQPSAPSLSGSFLRSSPASLFLSQPFFLSLSGSQTFPPHTTASFKGVCLFLKAESVTVPSSHVHFALGLRQLGSHALSSLFKTHERETEKRDRKAALHSSRSEFSTGLYQSQILNHLSPDFPPFYKTQEH